MGPPQLVPATSQPPPYGTQSSGVVRSAPDLRPRTVSVTSGSPAIVSRLNRPRVARWISTSRPTIGLAYLCSHGCRPIRIASHRTGFMAGA